MERWWPETGVQMQRTARCQADRGRRSSRWRCSLAHALAQMRREAGGMSGRTTGGPHFRIPWKGSGESCTAGSGRKVIGGPKPNHAADPGGSETRRECPGVSRSIRGANAPGGVALPQRRRANAWGEVYLPARVKALEYAETPSGVWSPPPPPEHAGTGGGCPPAAAGRSGHRHTRQSGAEG